MVQLRENRSFTVRFASIISVITAILSLALAGVSIGVKLPVLLRFLGIISLVALLVSILLNRWLWRAWPFSWILQIPDFAGRWEGWYRRSVDDKWRETAHEIFQNALDIDAEAWGPENWSRGTCSAIIVTSHGLTNELVWAYKTEPTTLTSQPGDTHAGVHFLHIVEKDGERHILGKYINDRAHQDGRKGAVGEIRLKWVSKKLQHALNYKEDNWGLNKPDAPTT